MKKNSSMENPSAVMKDEEIEENLFHMVQKNDWNQVIELYKMYKKAHRAKITPSGDTALHVAVSREEIATVEKLVKMIVSKQTNDEPEYGKEVLLIQNAKGDTPLHVAAAAASSRMSHYMCKVITEAISCPSSLVEARNKKSETPLFYAALQGDIHNFLHLHSICGDKGTGASYCRRQDGQTALHCAIAREHYNLAFQIIQLYPELVNSVDEQGYSALHILATKSFAFESGGSFGRWNSLVYHFIKPVEELKAEEISNEKHEVINIDEEYNRDNTENSEDPNKVTPNEEHKVTIRDNTDKEHNRDSTENPEDPDKVTPNEEHKVTVRENTDKEHNRDNTENSEKDPNTVAPTEKHKGQQLTDGGAQGHQNYICFKCRKITKYCMRLLLIPAFVAYVLLLIIVGIIFVLYLPISEIWYIMESRIERIREEKKKHIWSVQIMNELLKNASTYKYENNGASPLATTPPYKLDGPYEIYDGKKVTFASTIIDPPLTDQQHNHNGKKDDGKASQHVETAILIAAKNGVTEIVTKILEVYPEAIYDVNAENKNIVLLAAEHRQLYLFRMLQKNSVIEAFYEVDNKGNSVLHLAAMLQGDSKPWQHSWAALQLQQEIKWYESVKNSWYRLVNLCNNENKTPEEVFGETHKQLVQESSKWLSSIAKSCLVVAGLFVTMTFNTSTSIPGGADEKTGVPYMENHPAFGVFALLSQVAFYSSVTTVVMFLAILTSAQQMSHELNTRLLRKLLIGLTAFYLCIASTLVSFSCAHFFLYKTKLKEAASPVYATTCAFVTLFAIAQFPLFFQLFRDTLTWRPKSRFRNVISPLMDNDSNAIIRLSRL